MAEPTYKPARNWTRAKRFDEAVKRVVNEQWSQAKAAEYYGVSRPRLNEHVKMWREKQLEQSVTAAAVSPLGLEERKRVPTTIQEFDDHYFSHWVCPDCETHHPRPKFHDEIWDAMYSGTKRNLFNVPPYHSKSTNITIKGSVFDICQDPNTSIIVVSKSQPFARTFLVSISELLTNHELYLPDRDLIDDYGPFRDADKAWNQNHIYVAGRRTMEKDPTVQVLGLEGQIYGRRAKKLRMDDCATLENQRNPERVMQQLTWIDKEALSRIGRNGVADIVGTRVHPGDIYSVLGKRTGYNVLRYPCILDEHAEQTLWPDHFPYPDAVLKRDEMTEADWQLVYQNVEMPGLGASFTQDMIDLCLDRERGDGEFDGGWVLIAGLDPANTGYMAGILEAVDMRTGNRFLVDIFNVKGMRAPQLKDQIFQWCDMYPIYEWRVEDNAMNAQVVQYNEEIVHELARRGIRVVPHHTDSKKWDSQFGVESMAPLYSAGLVSIPWKTANARRKFQPLVEQLMQFPMGTLSDTVMAHWFADLGCRDILRRSHLPLFDQKRNVPERIKKRRIVVDFERQEVRRIPAHEQRGGVLEGYGGRGYRRMMVGRPGRHNVEHEAPPEPKRLVNVDRVIEPV